MTERLRTTGYEAGSILRMLLLTVLMSIPGAASAVPAFTIGATNEQGLATPPTFTLGWELTTNAPIRVTALGLFDSGQDGLAESHDIGLWDSTETLLASATIGNGTSGTLINQFRYVSISDVVLGAGQYRVGALYLTGADPIVFSGQADDFATAPGITFNVPAFAASNTLVFPLGELPGAPAFFGPNFIISDLPEPTTLALFGLGLAGLQWGRRKSGRATA